MWFSLSQLLKKILKQANKQKENKKSLQFSKLSILRVKFPWKNSHFLEFFHPGSSVIWGISLPATPYSHLVSSRSVDFKASSVQSLSCVWCFVTPWAAAHQASLSITNSQSLLKLMSIELLMPSNHPISCRPLLLLPSIFPSIKVFSSESVLCIRWPKYWSFSYSINPSNEYSGLISFRIDWFNLFTVQGLSRDFSNTTVPKHQFFGAQLCL